MAVLSRIKQPILWQEITHQTRSAPRRTWLGRLAVPLVLLTVLIGVPLTLTHFETAVRSTREIALFVIWVTHALTAVRCVVAGANAISREHVGQTWDALVLTGMSTRAIVLGKWRAALRRVAPWMLVLGTVRLTMLPVLMMASVNRVSYYWYRRYGLSYGGGYDDPVMTLEWVAWAAILAVTATVALTILEVLCCTALGLFASAFTRRGAAAAAFGVTLRFAPVIAFAAFTRYEIGASSFRWFRFAPFALADGGTSPLLQLVMPLTPWGAGRHLGALHGLIGSVVMLSALMLVALALTLVLVRRSGAMSHREATASI